ncbi:MAG: F0F1 ATP synthase subunit B [Pseudomonas sp.]|uniref:F0F1 ATP synthase subunit B n=1 Tax=Pseudomonas sp. TaxID=306 RepID=UPI0027372117|nr:F0F1 ATP synthase subunit B [Pseudomonas sp.]MDP3847622.1 F0F1 ATP synthase subunit B [Pseudomonas sp.]
MNINATLIGQSVAFFIFVMFCMKFVWPPVITAMRERQKKIADGLDAASRATRDLELAHEKVGQQLREAKTQAAEIIEQAKKRGTQLVDEARDQARVEAERVKAQAQAEIEQEINSVKDALRAQLGSLAVSGAEKILSATIDQNAHAELVAKLAAEI